MREKITRNLADEGDDIWVSGSEFYLKKKNSGQSEGKAKQCKGRRGG